MFAGWLKTGGFKTSVVQTQMFPGFPSRSFGNYGMIGGVPSTNLVAWFNPSINVTIGTGVSSWKDTSGTYNLSQSTGANQPSYSTANISYNNRPYLSFNGSSMFLNGGNILNIGTNVYLDVVCIYKTLNIGTAQFVIDSTNSSSLTGRYGLGHNVTNYFALYIDSTSQKVAAGLNNSSTVTMQMCSLDRVNGKLYESSDYQWRLSNTATNVENTSFINNNFMLGAGAGTTDFWNGDILDIFIYMGTTGGCMNQNDYLALRQYMGQLYNF